MHPIVPVHPNLFLNCFFDLLALLLLPSPRTLQFLWNLGVITTSLALHVHFLHRNAVLARNLQLSYVDVIMLDLKQLFTLTVVEVLQLIFIDTIVTHEFQVVDDKSFAIRRQLQDRIVQVHVLESLIDIVVVLHA